MVRNLNVEYIEYVTSNNILPISDIQKIFNETFKKCQQHFFKHRN